MKMKAKVDKNKCIGCGACTAIASNVFEIDDDGLAKVVVEEVNEEDKESVVDAKESCPASAIDTEENK